MHAIESSIGSDERPDSEHIKFDDVWLSSLMRFHFNGLDFKSCCDCVSMQFTIATTPKQQKKSESFLVHSNRQYIQTSLPLQWHNDIQFSSTVKS